MSGIRGLRCRIFGHVVRFGLFDRTVLAHDLFCTRCGASTTAQELHEALSRTDIARNTQ